MLYRFIYMLGVRVFLEKWECPGLRQLATKYQQRGMEAATLGCLGCSEVLNNIFSIMALHPARWTSGPSWRVFKDPVPCLRKGRRSKASLDRQVEAARSLTYPIPKRMEKRRLSPRTPYFAFSLFSGTRYIDAPVAIISIIGERVSRDHTKLSLHTSGKLEYRTSGYEVLHVDFWSRLMLPHMLFQHSGTMRCK